jgi:hypothetical protein
MMLGLSRVLSLLKRGVIVPSEVETGCRRTQKCHLPSSRGHSLILVSSHTKSQEKSNRR